MGALGGGDDAIARAAAAPNVAQRLAFPQIQLPTGACGSLGGGCVANPANGNLQLQTSPPGGDSFYIPPVLSYNSTNTASSEFGNGWTSTFSRSQSVSGSQLTVVTGDGNTYYYNASGWVGGYYPALSGNPTSPNSMFTANDSVFPCLETTPDGVQYQYRGSASPYLLGKIANPAGATWSLTRDSSLRVTVITDPLNRSTTLSYSATYGKISSITDPFGRTTTYTVNSSGNLVQITSPELCIYSLTYDSLNRVNAWINPIGDTTSYSYDSSNRVVAVQSPLGQITSFAYGAGNQTVVTNPLGLTSTLTFNAQGSLLSAVNATGKTTTYTWNNLNRLVAITDGAANTTSFTYASQANQINYLASVSQPLGGIFTYNYQ